MSIKWADGRLSVGDSGREWLVWQLVDSAFPAGGFAHSGGLEAAWQHGMVVSAQDLGGFLREGLRQAVYGAVPMVAGVFEPAADSRDLDGLLDCMLSNHVANRASRAQGRAFLLAAERVFQGEDLIATRQEVAFGKTQGHLAVVFGVVMRSLGLERMTAIRLYLFVAMRSILSAAVRLGIVGPMQAQQIQFGMSDELEKFAEQGSRLSVADMAQTSPLVELWQATQDRLYSRLFQS